MNLSSAARIAQSGLGSVAGEMSLVSRNIAGAGDQSYSRKIGNVVSSAGGAQLGASSRASNLAVFKNLLTATASVATKETLVSGLDSLAATLGDIASGNGSPADDLVNFTDALQAYESSPSDSTAAANVVSAAKSLTNKLNSTSLSVQQQRAQSDSDMARSVQNVNSLLDRIGIVNTQIVKGTFAGTDVTDLLDRRDSFLGQLSKEIGITTSTSANGDISIYTDSGVTLFQGGRSRSVTFEAKNAYSPTIAGNPVFVDGVPVTGGSAVMSLGAGNLAGAAALRDEILVTYQAQLDAMGGALVDGFAESDQIGSGPDLPGLFTTPGAVALPSVTVGIASQITVNASVDPARGGQPDLLRDGSVSSPGNAAYTYNVNAQASFTGRISELLGKLSETRTFSSSGGIDTQTSIGGYAAASVGWLSGERQNIQTEKNYQDVLLNAATSALSDVTGVNLDSEMSKMLALEQSYSATARLIAAIDDMFSTLINKI
jgi:flagellar hook-associated protein 1 FlgK